MTFEEFVGPQTPLFFGEVLSEDIAVGCEVLGEAAVAPEESDDAPVSFEREDDLLVVSGILFRRLVLVPYGRMQLVDVRRGPLERYLGLATVQLHTAAATTDATIPGLPPDVAGRLRDQLAALGEQRSAGL